MTTWEYKGHTCRITLDYEDDNIKAWHEVTKPGEDKATFADITPYDQRPLVVELWIDAGYPERIGCGPLHEEDLRKMIEERELEEMFDGESD